MTTRTPPWKGWLWELYQNVNDLASNFHQVGDSGQRCKPPLFMLARIFGCWHQHYDTKTDNNFAVGCSSNSCDLKIWLDYHSRWNPSPANLESVRWENAREREEEGGEQGGGDATRQERAGKGEKYKRCISGFSMFVCVIRCVYPRLCVWMWIGVTLSPCIFMRECKWGALLSDLISPWLYDFQS